MEIDFVKSEEYKQFERTIKLIFRCFKQRPLIYLITTFSFLFFLIAIIGIFPV